MARPPLAVGTYGTIRIKKAGDGYHAHAYVRDADGRRREVSRWRETKAAAERALKAALADRQGAAGDSETTGDTRYNGVLDLYLAQIDQSTSKATQTKVLYRNNVENHIRPALGNLRLRELTVPRVDAALRAIRVNSGPGTARTSRAVLSGSLGLAVRLGAITANPVRDTEQLTSSGKKAPRALTDVERDRISDRLRTDDPLGKKASALDLPDVVDWMLGTGMRIGEVCAIRYGENVDGKPLLDLDAGTVEVNATIIRVTRKDATRLGIPSGLYVQERAKSDAGHRVLALPPDLVDMLRRRRLEPHTLSPPRELQFLDEHGKARTGSGAGLVFTSPTGRLRDPSNTLADLRDVLNAIDRPDDADAGPFAWVTSHVFRKTVATRLGETLPPNVVADVMGHSKPSMTMDVYYGRKVVSAQAATILARPGRAAA